MSAEPLLTDLDRQAIAVSKALAADAGTASALAKTSIEAPAAICRASIVLIATTSFLSVSTF